MLGNNYYMIKGFVGEDNEDELFELVDAVINFKIANEEEIVISEEEFNEIHKEIIQEFEVEVEPWKCGTA